MGYNSTYIRNSWIIVSLVSMIVVSLMTKAPDLATQKMVDEVRVPSGKTVLGKQH